MAAPPKLSQCRLPSQLGGYHDKDSGNPHISCVKRSLHHGNPNKSPVCGPLRVPAAWSGRFPAPPPPPLSRFPLARVSEGARTIATPPHTSKPLLLLANAAFVLLGLEEGPEIVEVDAPCAML